MERRGSRCGLFCFPDVSLFEYNESTILLLIVVQRDIVIGRLEPRPTDPQSDMITFVNCAFIGNLSVCASKFLLRSHSFFLQSP